MTDRCEFKHASVPCDGEAAFTLTRHGGTKPICESAAKHLWTLMGGRCFECRSKRHTHWSITELKAQVPA